MNTLSWSQSAQRWQQVRFTPGRRLAAALLLVTPLFVLSWPWPAFAFVADGLLLGLAWLEAFRLRARLPVLSRTLPARMSLGADNYVTIRVQNCGSQRLRGEVRDDAPELFVCSPSELRFDLNANEGTTLRYAVAVHRRGQYSFGAIHVRVDGPLSLGSVIAVHDAAADVRVYPSPVGPQRYELALRRGALHGVGIRSTRRPGGGGELEQLREYVAGDALRDLCWKASAKRLRPITRVHGQEQSQTVLIALDAGRLMAAQLDGLSKLDHAIHAALLLSWVALRTGDRVGVVVLEQQALHYVAPARGSGQYRRILDALYAVEASDAYVDFRALASFVRRRVPRRSLLLLFSDLLDESQALPLAAELPKLRPKHLPLCVTLNDPVAATLAHAPVTDTDQVYLRAAAADLVAERALTKRQLTRAGVQVVEASAATLSVEIVNRYLEIKRQRTL